MKKLSVLLTLCLLSVLLLAACGCEHTWLDPDCLHPRTCSQCHKTEGAPLGHVWAAATCQAPQTCTNCKKTEGEPLPHTWEDADCETPKTCSVCKTTEGEALGHNADAATCETASVCKTCSKQLAPATGHDASAATCEEASICKTCKLQLAPATGHTWVDATTEAPKTCSVCKKTEGEPLSYKHFGITMPDYVKAMNTSLDLLGMKLQAGGTTDDGIIVYNVLNRDNSDTKVQVGFYLSADGAYVAAVVCGTDYGHENTASTITGNCLGIAAFIADNTFSQSDLLALQSNVTVSPDGKIYTYQHTRNGVSYVMQVSQVGTGAELFTIVQAI